MDAQRREPDLGAQVSALEHARPGPELEHRVHPSTLARVWRARSQPDHTIFPSASQKPSLSRGIC
jgi:hypothetical protein